MMRQRAWLIRYPQAFRGLGMFAFLLFLIGGLQACEPVNLQTPSPSEGITSPAAPENTPTPAAPTQVIPPTLQADITLTEVQSQQTTSVQVGNEINVRGFTEGNWTISYNTTFLELMTAPEIVNQPGPDGWFFRALTPGETVILLESVPPPCPSEPCMPNIQRFEFLIQVVP